MLCGGQTVGLRLPSSVPLGSFNMAIDASSAVFALPIALVRALAAISGREYLRHHAGEKRGQTPFVPSIVLFPDPVTCFAGSRYVQEQHIRMEPAANLVLVDWLTAGRVGSGERWQFTEYRSRTFVWRADRLVLHDGLVLAPEDGDLAGRMGRFNCLALAVVSGPALRATATRLAGSIGSAPAPRRAELLLSAAPLGDDGVVLRIAGVSVEQVGAALRQHLSVVTSLLGDDPWSCKF